MNNDFYNKKLYSQLNKIQSILDKINSDSFKCLSNEDKNSLYSQLDFEGENFADIVRKYSINSIKNISPTIDVRNKIGTYTSKISCEKINDSLVKIVLPPLLNHQTLIKKDKIFLIKTPSFFKKEAREIIKKFIIENNFSVDKNKKILFVFNLINKDMENRYVVDTDNREYRELFNLVKEFFVPDDAPEYISYFLDTLKSKSEEKTIVFLSSVENIQENYSLIKKELKTYSAE